MKVTEKPIIFSTPMVQAILEGRKTQTRRVINPQPTAWQKNPCFLQWKSEEPKTLSCLESVCPYGSVGSRLWVRETWRNRNEPIGSKVYYKADDNGCLDLSGTWKPSIFMQRQYSRINLEITNIRVERLQEIGCKGIKAEGFCIHPQSGSCDKVIRSQFGVGWDSVNGKRPGCDWKSNPFVWVIEFKKVSQ